MPLSKCTPCHIHVLDHCVWKGNILYMFLYPIEGRDENGFTLVFNEDQLVDITPACTDDKSKIFIFIFVIYKIQNFTVVTK